jgi:hypothetical protein
MEQKKKQAKPQPKQNEQGEANEYQMPFDKAMQIVAKADKTRVDQSIKQANSRSDI